MDKIKIFALGGLQENGKNLYIVEVDEQIFILDAGLKYPTQELYGVDIIIPDISYLIANKSRVAGIFLTHGHDDHIGSVIYILKEIPTKVYASKFTLAVLQDTFKNENINFSDDVFVEINRKTALPFANEVTVRFFEVSHDVPDSYGIVIMTRDGNIVYTGNYNFDQNSKVNYSAMFRSLAVFSQSGVLALLSESLGANNAENRGSILEFKIRMNNLFVSSHNRMVFSLFSSDILRIQQIVNIAVEHNRKIALIGLKTQRLVYLAITLGYLRVPKENLVALKYIDDNNKNEMEDLVVLVTGERHEPYYNLQRMANGVDRLIHLNDKDTVVILTKPYLGTEKIAAKTMDIVYRKTSNVKVFKSELFPASSASREEIKEMINILRPKYVIPVIGEYRHQYNFRIVANCIGYSDDKIIILDNGDVASFEDGKYIGTTGDVHVGEILIDGKTFGDVGDVVMRDRELLADDGVILIAANINPKSKKVVVGPEIISRGFIYTKENEEIMSLIKDGFDKVSSKFLTTKFINWSDYKNALKTEINYVVYRKTKRNPIIIPVLISTDVETLKTQAN